MPKPQKLRAVENGRRHDGPAAATTRSPHRRLWTLALGSVVALALLPVTSAEATSTMPTGDPKVISEWNAIAASTVAADPGRIGHPQVILYMGFVEAAVYDAVVGVDGRYEPYLSHARAPHGTSDTAAAVAAAHQVLITYFPYATSSLDAAYANSLAQIPDGKAKTKGIEFGIRVADRLIARRADDGRDAPIVFTQAPAPGVWRPTPPAHLSMFDPWLGFVTPLLVHSPTQFGPPPPPALTSARYTRDFDETKAYGSATGSLRSPDQTATALFFSGNVLLQDNAMIRDQAAMRNLDIIDSARMFAAADMSAADAIITVWRAKFDYGFWRPITAINEADTDGNPATVADPAWVPLATTPAYPEYPSGYNSQIATTTGSLRELFHTDQLNLNLISSAVTGVTRHYETGSALRSDVVSARVWLGFHFRFADVASRNLGLRLSDWTIDHYFQRSDDR